MLFCENCGNQISDTAKFCPKCGESLIKDYDSQKLSRPTVENSNINYKVNDITEKREKLIKVLLEKYINEYLYLLIISSLVSISSYTYYLITLSESATGWTVFGGLFVIVSFPTLLVRLHKRNNLIKVLSSNLSHSSEIWAEKQTDKIYRPGMWGNESNTFVLHALGKSYNVPEVMLPYTLDECLEIINFKTT